VCYDSCLYGRVILSAPHNGYKPAFRSPLPKVMMKSTNPVGSDNDQHLTRWLKIAHSDAANMVVVAWGNDGSHLDRDTQIFDMIAQEGLLPLCFGINQNGSPKHPTYLANNLDLIPYKLTNHQERKIEE